MVGSATPVIVGALLFLCVVVVAGLVVGLLAWRSARRRWRALRAHVAVRGAQALWTSIASGAFGRRPSARQELWQAVHDAEQTVHEADRAGAPVAELPALCRRLQAAAEDVDRLLAMGNGLDPASGAASAVHRQVDEVISASARIRLAALAAAGEAAAPRIRALTDDADQEVRCVAAGVASSRAAGLHRPR